MRPEISRTYCDVLIGRAKGGPDRLKALALQREEPPSTSVLAPPWFGERACDRESVTQGTATRGRMRYGARVPPSLRQG
jgi:hypothetical protein